MGHEWQTFDQQRRFDEASAGMPQDPGQAPRSSWLRKLLPVLLTVAMVGGFWLVFLWATAAP